MIKLVPNSSTGIEGSISEFQWSTTEQEWPFEKESGGGILYAKEVIVTTLPNAGSVYTTVSGIATNKIFKIDGYKQRKTSSYDTYQIPEGTYLHQVGISSNDTLYVYSSADSSGWRGIFKLLYWK